MSTLDKRGNVRNMNLALSSIYFKHFWLIITMEKIHVSKIGLINLNMRRKGVLFKF